MDAISEVRSRVDAVGDGLERVADPRKRPRVLALLDPFDIAGHATRTILPTHPTPALARTWPTSPSWARSSRPRSSSRPSPC